MALSDANHEYIYRTKAMVDNDTRSPVITELFSNLPSSVDDMASQKA